MYLNIYYLLFAGQFRTPRHIIAQKNETILDPAFTSGFLISSYKHILNQNTKKRRWINCIFGKLKWL